MRALPTACYRLQLRNGVDFAAAERLLPYLGDLGISHLYLSPIFTAQPGSSHGYDVIDPAQIDPVLGGRAGFTRLAKAAQAHDIGIVLDVVPNHVAFTLENPWLRDLLAKGRRSQYLRHFDIAQERRLALPMLKAPFEEILEQGGFAVERGAGDGGAVLIHGDLRVPLDRATLPDTLPETPAALRELHARQFWRLCHWRTERDAITHRRFFNITGLIGLRIEEQAVFDDVHRLIFELVDAGLVAGLRIDHIDGLAEPAAYLRRLRARLPGVPVWLEKILALGESLPDWPVEGTTGYVLARDIGQVLTESDGVVRIDAQYRRETEQQAGFGVVVTAAKRALLEGELAAELWALQGLVGDAARHHDNMCEYGPETWRQAILGLIAHLRRYRTYFDGTPGRAEEIAALEAAADAAARGMADRRPLDFLTAALCAPDAAHMALRRRFQQVAGAVMAKGQEDTAFYRYNRLLSANEVGAEPEQSAIDAATFHQRMVARARDMPHGLSLTSSHDTKRSEDARMRIAALSHHPETMAALMDWASGQDGAADVDPNMRWYLVQTLWAMCPRADAAQEIAERLCAHATKAMREAKQGTTWQAPNAPFERAVLAFARNLAEAAGEMPEQTGAAARTAERLSLVQLALKLTLPGVPDIYRGCEIGNYRLTDPDNRAAVDFDPLKAALVDKGGLSPFDRDKLSLTRAGLALRRSDPQLFRDGSYEPLDAPLGGLAFRRRLGASAVRVVVTLGARLPTEALRAAAGESCVWRMSGVGGVFLPSAPNCPSFGTSGALRR